MEVLVGQLLIGGPWNLAIYSKGASTLNLPGERPLAFWKSSSVQVLVISWSFGSVYVCVSSELGPKFSLSMLLLHNLFWSVVSDPWISLIC